MPLAKAVLLTCDASSTGACAAGMTERASAGAPADVEVGLAAAVPGVKDIPGMFLAQSCFAISVGECHER